MRAKWSLWIAPDRTTDHDEREHRDPEDREERSVPHCQEPPGEDVPLPVIIDDEPNARPPGRRIEHARVEAIDEPPETLG
jgi:hypothetical protein